MIGHGRSARRAPGAASEEQVAPLPEEPGTAAASSAASAGGGTGTTGAGVTGAVGEAAATRSGEDTRRRGWFWHWNSIVTQYAPLLGLKGIGLLNSYTVWTDRREESPHRGYAFPSQQSEADFYGEDRAELITINKILVALDLIEIRKEMVLRTDERGRRWRVPHNFYRVKDHADGSSLTAADVLRVVELADRDKAVYRYVRRLFSPRFSPIDAANEWHRILPELRRTDTWQRLAARAAREEDKASARTRAGHAARRGNAAADAGDTATPNDTDNDSSTVSSLPPAGTSVASINKGSEVDVDVTNDGFERESATGVEPANGGGPTAVGRANTTYDQSGLTTTTTREDVQNGSRGPRPVETDRRSPQGIERATPPPVPARSRAERNTDVVPEPALRSTPTATGPGGQAAPADAPGEIAAIRAFEAANARPATPAERQLLRGLAERFDPAARAAGRSDLASGWSWIAAAVYEAVEAGSAFVAPRRLREILTRWEREGLPVDTEADTARSEEILRSRPSATPGIVASPASTAQRASAVAHAVPVADLLGDAPDLPLPHGFGSRRTWAFAVGLLGEAVERGRLADLVAGTAIVGYHEGEVTVGVPDPVRAEQFATTYRDLVARKLSEAMRRPVRLAVLTLAPAAGPEGLVETDPAGDRGAVASHPLTGGTSGPALDGENGATGASGATPAIPTFLVEECGLPSGQVWAAVLDELAVSGEVSRANFDTWLRATALIGRDPAGALVVGVPHALAQRRIAARFGPSLRAAVVAVVGVRLPVEVVVATEWLRANHPVGHRRPPSPRSDSTAAS